MNQIAVQHNYLLKQIYVNGGNMFGFFSLHNVELS
jgi:hypothetical protein